MKNRTRHRPSPARRRHPALGYAALLLPPIGELRAQPSAFGWAFLAAVLTMLCHPPFGFWPLAFVSLVPWLWALRRKTPRAAFWISWFFGSWWMLFLFFWLHHLSAFNPAIYLGIPLLALFQGLFPAVAGGLFVWAAGRTGPTRALCASVVVWTGLEWLRTVGELAAPCGQLGAGARDLIPFIQVASLGGVYLASALVMAFNIAMMEVLVLATKRLFDPVSAARIGAAAALVIGATAWGGMVVSSSRERDAGGVSVRVAMLQPNIAQDEKVESYSSFDPDVRDRLNTAMTVQLLGMLDALDRGVDLVVMPESAFTDSGFEFDEDLQRALRDRAEEHGAVLVAGATDLLFRTPGGGLTDDLAGAQTNAAGFAEIEVANAIFTFSPHDQETKNAADYRKIALMPFGEAAPFGRFLPVLNRLQENFLGIGSFVRGERQQPLLAAHGAPAAEDPLAPRPVFLMGPSICFEDLFAGLHRRMAKRGAQLYVNVTNNAWFDPGAGSTFHFEYARLRCVENRLPMVRATNSGITAVIDSTGAVAERGPLREEATVLATIMVPADPSPTLYARLGDWFGMGCFLGGLFLVVGLARRRRPQLEVAGGEFE